VGCILAPLRGSGPLGFVKTGEDARPPLKSNPDRTRALRPIRSVPTYLIERANAAAIWYLLAFILLINLMKEC
jgi:hypothetical protein